METAAPHLKPKAGKDTPSRSCSRELARYRVTRPTFRKSPMVRELSEKELSLTSPQSFEIFTECLSESSELEKDAL